MDVFLPHPLFRHHKKHAFSCKVNMPLPFLFMFISVRTSWFSPMTPAGVTIKNECRQPLKHPDSGLDFQKERFEIILKHLPKFERVYGLIKKRRRQKASGEIRR
jgi:hypothetical protein